MYVYIYIYAPFSSFILHPDSPSSPVVRLYTTGAPRKMISVDMAADRHFSAEDGEKENL
jgi:hypothetical protein